MLTRRGFLGALTAIVAAPRALFAQPRLWYIDFAGRMHRFNVTDIPPQQVLERRLYRSSSDGTRYQYIATIHHSESTTYQ